MDHKKGRRQENSQNVKLASDAAPAAPPENLTLSQVMEETGHSYYRLKRAIDRGRLRVHRPGGDYGPYVVNRRDLDRYLTGCEGDTGVRHVAVGSR